MMGAEVTAVCVRATEVTGVCVRGTEVTGVCAQGYRDHRGIPSGCACFSLSVTEQVTQSQPGSAHLPNLL